MTASHARPVPGGGGEPCTSCDARPHSVCGAVALEDLPRLAALATVRVLDPGQGFVAEGDPAEHFFSITAGTAKLFKLLPDGRRQITGFMGVGQFLGLARHDDGVFAAVPIQIAGPVAFVQITQHDHAHGGNRKC